MKSEIHLRGRPRAAARAWLGMVVRHPWPVLAGVLLLAAASLYLAARQLGVHTDPADLLDRDLPFQSVRAEIAAAFPYMERSLLMVVEAPTPEQARQGAERVAAAAQARPEIFPELDWPPGEPFFLDNGLLLRSLDDLDTLVEELSRAQPMLARLAENPTVPGLLGLLTEAVEHEDEHEIDLEFVFTALAASLEAALDGEQRPLSWQRLLSPETENATAAPAREVLLVRPALDFKRVMAGRDAMAAAKAVRDELGMDEGPLRLRLTGSVALAYEELHSVLEGARLAGLLALGLVTLMMYVGLRSLRLVAVALLSLLAGLAVTLGFATLAIGHLNLVSIAFTVLYVGLGVNYAIHFLLRYREGLAEGLGREGAVGFAGGRLLGALALSALTTAIGFFAFVPTAYAGVAELGLIAGVAMGVTFAISYTLLPALLALLPPPGNTHRDRVPVLPARVLDVPLRHRTAVRWGALALGLVAVLLATQLRFDSDPLNLRDPDSESVRTLRDLLAERSSGHRNLQALVGSGEEAADLVERLKALPSVDKAVSLRSFVPADQDEKLAQIEELRWLLGPDVLAARWWAPAATPAADLEAVAPLREALGTATPSESGARFDAALARLETRLREAPATEATALAVRAHESLLSLLPVTMGLLGRALAVEEPVSFDSLPQDLKRHWLSPEGRWLVQIFPAEDLSDPAEQHRFVEEVRGVQAAVSGMPVIQLESGRAIAGAFREAIGLAVVGIALVLLLTLRSVKLTVKVLVPLGLGGLLTAALMVGLGIPFNFANVVALPLLLGVGVDNGIHLVYRHRAGDLPGGNVLRSATARGIVFGALTTVASFGNLAFSPHAGTASLGVILATGLSLMVLATLVVLPALLRR